MTQYVTNPIIRDRAKQAVHNNLGRLIVMMLIHLAFVIALVMIPVLIYRQDAEKALYLTSTYSSTFMKNYPSAFLNTWKPIFCMLGLIIVEVGVLLPWMIAGHRKALIEMARGTKPSIGMLFCRFRNFFGCIGLDLWVSFKLLLWALPTFALIYLVAFVGVVIDTNPLLAIPTALWLIPLAICLIPASYRYSMAFFLYADDPAIGVFGAVRKSKDMMRYRKWQLFKLTFLYTLLASAITELSTLISDGLATSDALIASILGLVISLAALALSFYLALRTWMSQVCFYEAYHISPRDQ